MKGSKCPWQRLMMISASSRQRRIGYSQDFAYRDEIAGRPMFIAMNRFKVIPGAQAEFEKVWTSRDTHLRDVPGFLAFHLLRGPDREDHTLYSSHSLWRSRD